MNWTLTFYIGAAICDVLGVIFVAGGFRARRDALRQPPLPEPELPSSYNEMPELAALMRSVLSPEERDARLAGGLNEIIEALDAQAVVLVANQQRLERVMGAPARPWELSVSAVLLTLGIGLGAAGNIAGALH